MQSKFINIDGVRMHYLEGGQGAPLIVMHGWGCNATTVQSISDTAMQHRTVYAVDFPGFGQSPEPPGVWGVEEYTRLIEKFVDALGLKDVSLLGHSFGGRVGLLYSSRHADVPQLILVDAAGIKPRRSLKYYLKVYSFKAAKNLANALLPKAQATALVERMRAGKGSADYAQASPTMRAILSKVVNEDLSHVLQHIKASTLLVWGENDTATPVWMAEKIKDGVTDSGLVVFKGCGHYSFLENRTQFAAVLNSFLKS